MSEHGENDFQRKIGKKIKLHGSRFHCNRPNDQRPTVYDKEISTNCQFKHQSAEHKKVVCVFRRNLKRVCRNPHLKNSQFTHSDYMRAGRVACVLAACEP